MTRNPYSLRAPISEAAYVAARPFPAAARADFALVADRSAPKKAPPPNFALFAGAAAPAGATPAGYALVADTRAIIANPWSKRALYVAIAIAFLLHLAVLAPFVLRLAPVFPNPRASWAWRTARPST